MKTTGLVRALACMFPDATFAIVHERPWHSLTFSGIQARISVTACERFSAEAAHFADRLPEHVFNLDHQLIADIAVVETDVISGNRRLLIEALILDD